MACVAGYEGGSSDTDEDSMSVMGSSSAHQQCSPFWIVIQTLTDKVNIFFHTRETEDESNGVLLHGQSVTKGVASNVHTICHTVNQVDDSCLMLAGAFICLSTVD